MEINVLRGLLQEKIEQFQKLDIDIYSKFKFSLEPDEKYKADRQKIIIYEVGK